MSYAYRSRLKELGLEKLKLEEEEWKFIQEHIADFCIGSDLKVKEKFGEAANEEEILSKEKMSDKEFTEFAIETIRETMEKLGYKKGRRRKAKVVEQDVTEDYNLLLQEQKIPQTLSQENELQFMGEQNHV